MNGVSILLPDQEGFTGFVTSEGRIDGAIGLTFDGSVICVWTSRMRCRRYRNAQRPVAHSANVVHKDGASIINKFRRPKATRCPRGLMGEYSAGCGPMLQVGGAEEGELRRPISGGAGCPIGLANANDGWIGMVPGEDRIAGFFKA